jgi:hypothetical protein
MMVISNSFGSATCIDRWAGNSWKLDYLEMHEIVGGDSIMEANSVKYIKYSLAQGNTSQYVENAQGGFGQRFTY